MRIIGGKFKNKKIDFPKNFKTRPLKDNVRESIFNILKHSNSINFELKNSYILDLYAGTGSFGLECLSRGAALSFFLESDEEALLYLKRNIKSLNVENETKVYPQKISKFLLNDKLQQTIDLVFFDPPYNNKDYIEVIKILKKKNILKKKHLIIIHREKGSNENSINDLSIIENRIYGRSEIFFSKFF